MSDINLSEELFAQPINCPETSQLIKRISSSNQKNPLTSHWYRMIDRLIWYWRGIHPLEVSQILSQIAAAPSKRSDDDLLDTAIGFHSGNWIYEWSQYAAENKEKIKNSPDLSPLEIGQLWRRVASLYSMAGYPHLRGDTLAVQADTLSYQAYQAATTFLPYHVKRLELNVDNRKLTCFLHLPDINKSSPVLLLCGNVDSLQHDYCRLFYDYLAPAGIAMLCVDNPTIGHSSHWKLSYDSSYLHQKVLHQLADIPWVDDKKVYVLGLNLGANIAVRLAYLEQNRLAGVISWAGIVHSGLTNGTYISQLNDMYKDIIASRLGLISVSDDLLRTELANYSLKNQGLLGRRCSTPMLAIAIENDKFSPLEESELIVSSSIDGELVKIQQPKRIQDLDNIMKYIVSWIKMKTI